MGTRMRLIGWTAALAALLMTSVPATAAPVGAPVKPKARGLLLTPLTLTRIQDLEFGSLIPSGTPGTVVINATSGARTTFGGVTALASGAGQRARFAGAGTPGQQVFVLVVPPTVLTNPNGDTLDVLALPLDGSPIRTIAPDRTFFVGVGGIISVAANQPDGLYTAEFEVFADYQ